ncbi:MAG: PqqD family protein [Ruminiclostridium sp.]|nr:PqqD family protein [Ruminiclostridium sp.]
MKLDPNFIIHSSNGEYYVITTGGGDFNGIVRNNETSDFICRCLREDTTEEAIIEKMLETYNAERSDVERDVKLVIEKLRSIGAIND